MKKAFYTEPLIEEIEVAIENGIAQSPGNGGWMEGSDPDGADD